MTVAASTDVEVGRDEMDDSDAVLFPPDLSTERIGIENAVIESKGVDEEKPVTLPPIDPTIA